MNREPKPITMGAAIGVTLLVVGLLAWVWTDEWRLALTGLALALVASALGAVKGR